MTHKPVFEPNKSIQELLTVYLRDHLELSQWDLQNGTLCIFTFTPPPPTGFGRWHGFALNDELLRVGRVGSNKIRQIPRESEGKLDPSAFSDRSSRLQRVFFFFLSPRLSLDRENKERSLIF